MKDNFMNDKFQGIDHKSTSTHNSKSLLQKTVQNSFLSEYQVCNFGRSKALSGRLSSHPTMTMAGDSCINDENLLKRTKLLPKPKTKTTTISSKSSNSTDRTKLYSFSLYDYMYTCNFFQRFMLFFRATNPVHLFASKARMYRVFHQQAQFEMKGFESGNNKLVFTKSEIEQFK